MKAREKMIENQGPEYYKMSTAGLIVFCVMIIDGIIYNLFGLIPSFFVLFIILGIAIYKALD